MAIFNSKLLNYQRVYPINFPLNQYKIPLKKKTHTHTFLKNAMNAMVSRLHAARLRSSAVPSRPRGP
jgi:hypothetical protein